MFGACLCFHRWEYDESYCEAVKKMPPYDAGPRLLDVIDTAVFDYLIGNADRHHYESFQDDGGASMLILLDNAKRCDGVHVGSFSLLGNKPDQNGPQLRFKPAQTVRSSYFGKWTRLDSVQADCS